MNNLKLKTIITTSVYEIDNAEITATVTHDVDLDVYDVKVISSAGYYASNVPFTNRAVAFNMVCINAQRQAKTIIELNQHLDKLHAS